MRMFHLGPDVLCPRASIVGIFDLDTATVSRHTRDFLRRAQEADEIITVGDDLPQSFVVTSDCRGGCPQPPVTTKIVYLSPQSSANLSKKLLTNP